MSYGRNVRRMFNLTNVDENPTHLENQIERLILEEVKAPKELSAINTSVSNINLNPF